MAQAASALNVTPSNRVTKKEIEAFIERNWPRELGPYSPTFVEQMAKFIRHPEHRTGGYLRVQDVSEQRASRKAAE
jgi:hypothetical protein